MNSTFKVRNIGSYFGIESQFELDFDKGIVLKDSVRFRVPPEQREALFYPDGTSICDLHAQLPNNVSDLLNRVKLATGLNIVILEFNFNRFSSYSCQFTEHKYINYQEIVKRPHLKRTFAKQRLNYERLFFNMYRYPLVAESYAEVAINNHMLGFMLETKLQFEACDLLIVTGEMLWSGWLNSYLLIKLLKSYDLKDQDIFLDYGGVWHSVYYHYLKQPVLLKINQDYFMPNLSWIKRELEHKKGIGVILELNREEEKRKIILNENRIGLFDLEKPGYRIGQKELGRLLYLDNYQLQEPSDQGAFLQWWRTKEMDGLFISRVGFVNAQLSCVKNEELVIHEKANRRFKEILSDKGEQVQLGQHIATEQLYKVKAFFLPMLKSDLKKMLVCVHGQIVDKGQLLGKVPTVGGIIQAKLVAPFPGKIDLSMLESMGIILLLTEQKQIPIHSPCKGVIKKVSKDRISIETEVRAIKISRLIGPETDGFLVWPKDISPTQSNVLLLKELSEFNYTVEDVIYRNITGIVVLSTSSKNLDEFIKRKSVILNFVSVAVVEDIGLNASEELSELLVKNRFKNINLTQSEILFPAEFVIHENLNNQAHIVLSELPNSGLIFSLDYLRSSPYARIVKSNSIDSILVSNKDEIFSVSLANIFIINHD